MRKRVLVTGAAGFIGFHVSQFLRERGDLVVGYDNFNDYYDPTLKRLRAEVLGIPFIEGDLCELKIDEKSRFTHIIHLAAQAGVRYSLENPQAYISSNIEGFGNILEYCRHHPEIKLIYASSSSVYGKNQKIPFSESDRVDNQSSLYGVTKKTNELMANTYHSLYGISVTGLRYFTVYGPWGRPDMAYYKFTEAILDNQPIEIYNHGKLARDFTYIDDIVRGTVAALDLESECEIFNLGNNQPIELGHFIEILEDALGKKAEKIMLPMQKGDVYRTYADISKSQKYLGYTPKTTLEEGIPHFIKWFKDVQVTH